MKQARLVLTALAVLMAGSAALAIACDQSKKTKATATSVSNASAACPASASCPHMTAAECKAAMAAGTCAHGAKGVSAAAAGMCSHDAKGVSAATAVTAGMCGNGAKASTASSAGMCDHDAKGVSAAAAGMCGKGAKSVSAAKATGSCDGHGMMTSAARSSHGDCDACSDMAGCEQEIEAVGAGTQVVPLKNGVMFVYTASSPANVHAVQAAMARRNDRMIQLASVDTKSKLCGTCKEMRTATANGRLNREVVNIEGGCLTLMTSNDPALVAKIHAMAGITTASRVKS